MGARAEEGANTRLAHVVRLPPSADLCVGVRLSRGRARCLCQEFMSMEGVVTDMRLNQNGSTVLDNDTHSVLPSQNDGCLAKMREVKAKYDPANLFCYASLSK